MFIRDEFGNLIFVPRSVCFAEAEGAGEGDGGTADSAAEGEGSSTAEGGGAKEGAKEGEGKAAAAAEGAGKGEEGATAIEEADWRAGITDPDAKKFADRSPDLNHLIKRAKDANDRLSKAIVPPGKDADDEEVAAYRKSIGVPEKPDGYTFKMPEGQEASESDKAFHAKMGELFHAANISADQAAQLNKGWNALSEAMRDAQIQEDKKFAEDSEKELRGEWRGDWDANRAHANRAAEQMFGDDLEDFRRLETSDGRFVADHPFVLRALASLGREMAEGGLVPSLSADQVERAEDELRDIRDKIAKAQSEGDSQRANSLYQKEQALIAKMKGSRPIVGSEGRAA